MSSRDLLPQRWSYKHISPCSDRRQIQILMHEQAHYQLCPPPIPRTKSFNSSFVHSFTNYLRSIFCLLGSMPDRQEGSSWDYTRSGFLQGLCSWHWEVGGWLPFQGWLHRKGPMTGRLLTSIVLIHSRDDGNRSAGSAGPIPWHLRSCRYTAHAFPATQQLLGMTLVTAILSEVMSLCWPVFTLDVEGSQWRW